MYTQARKDLNAIDANYGSTNTNSSETNSKTDEVEPLFSLVLMDSNSEMTFSSISKKFHPKLHLDFLLKRIYYEIKKKLLKINEEGSQQLWMYSGASRSVISTTSPIRKHLKNACPVQGSCSIGDGTPLQYIEKGFFNNSIDATVVKELRYDLFSSVSAAKQGYTSIIDYDLETGEKHSYMVDKQTGNIIPLIERGKEILEVPLQLMIPNYSAEGDTTDKETILYAFDIIK
jgi:hypothetical protein